MEIHINQKQISIGDKYTIYVDGVQAYKASRRIFKLLPTVDLYRGDDTVAVLTISKQFSLPRARYTLSRQDGSVVEFVHTSFWKRRFECISGADTYEVYGHRGRKFSIFKNDRQVAWWDKAAVSWFAGDNYTITADKDCDVELIIAFCLAIDNLTGDNHDGNVLTINVGNFIQSRAFDSTWQPK